MGVHVPEWEFMYVPEWEFMYIPEWEFMYLNSCEGVDLVHAMYVGLGELEVLNVGEVLPELAQVWDQLVKGDKVELDGWGAFGPLPVPGSLKKLDGGRSVHAQRIVLQLDEIVVALLAGPHRSVRVTALSLSIRIIFLQ